MINTIKKYLEEVESFSSQKAEEIEQFRIKYLGKKGILNDLFQKFKEVPNENKKEFGQLINNLKQSVAKKNRFFKRGC